MRFPLLFMVLFSISASSAFRQVEEEPRIDSPSAGESVSGIVEIIGTAAVPGMARYRLEFAYDPNPAATWFLIGEGTEPVRNGLLAVWDTSLISEGVYTLRIAAFLTDGSTRESVTGGIVLDREGPSASVPSEEVIPAAVPDSRDYGQAAAAFPAPTAAAESALPQTSRPVSPMGIAFLIGVILAFLGFALLWIRSRWLLWKHERFVREIRKGGS